MHGVTHSEALVWQFLKENRALSDYHIIYDHIIITEHYLI